MEIVARVISSRLIGGVKLKVIEEIGFIDSRDKYQETRYSLRNDPSGKRRVNVVNVGGIDVERILNFSVVDPKSRYWESVFGLLNMADPLVHYQTHNTKVYATDENGNKNYNVYIEVQRIDKIFVRDPNDRGQDTIFSLNWGDLTDPEWDYTDVPDPITDYDGTSINPPWRLDPFQNIVEGGLGHLLILYGENRVAAIPMSQLNNPGASGASGSSGSTGSSITLTPVYKAELTESRWNPTGHNQTTQMRSEKDVSFILTQITLTGAADAPEYGDLSYGPVKIVEDENTKFLTTNRMTEFIQSWVSTTVTHAGVEYKQMSSALVGDGEGRVFTGLDIFNWGPTGGTGDTGPNYLIWSSPGGANTDDVIANPYAINPDGTYYYGALGAQSLEANPYGIFDDVPTSRPIKTFVCYWEGIDGSKTIHVETGPFIPGGYTAFDGLYSMDFPTITLTQDGGVDRFTKANVHVSARQMQSIFFTGTTGAEYYSDVLAFESSVSNDYTTYYDKTDYKIVPYTATGCGGNAYKTIYVKTGKNEATDGELTWTSSLVNKGLKYEKTVYCENGSSIDIYVPDIESGATGFYTQTPLTIIYDHPIGVNGKPYTSTTQSQPLTGKKNFDYIYGIPLTAGGTGSYFKVRHPWGEITKNNPVDDYFWPDTYYRGAKHYDFLGKFSLSNGNNILHGFVVYDLDPNEDYHIRLEGDNDFRFYLNGEDATQNIVDALNADVTGYTGSTGFTGSTGATGASAYDIKYMFMDIPLSLIKRIV